jgi:hypothetical protein
MNYLKYCKKNAVLGFVLSPSVIWGQSAKALARRISALQKRAVRYMAGLKLLESCRNRFRLPEILTAYSLYIQESILYAK